MNQPEKHLESLRKDYLQQRYPGDLSDVVETLPDPESKPGRTSIDPPDQFPARDRWGWALAAMVLIAVTLGLLWIASPGTETPVAESGDRKTLSPANTKKTTRLSLFALKRPVRFHPVISKNAKSPKRTKSWNVARKPKAESSSASEAQPSSSKPSTHVQRRTHWATGKTLLPKNHFASLAKSYNSRKKSRSRKSGPRTQFKSRFQFKPIQYRRS